VFNNYCVRTYTTEHEKYIINTFILYFIYLHVLCTFGFEPIFTKVHRIDLATNQITFLLFSYLFIFILSIFNQTKVTFSKGIHFFSEHMVCIYMNSCATTL